MHDSQASKSVLSDQDQLIRTLHEEKVANERRFEVLKKAIEDAKNPVSSPIPPKTTQETTRAVPSPLRNNFHVFAAQALPKSTVADSSQAVVAENAAYAELEHYCRLIAALLAEVDAVKYQLETDLRQELKDGLVDFHGYHLPLIELSGDKEAVRNAFDGLLPVSSTICIFSVSRAIVII